MDFGMAFGFVFQDKDWLRKVLIVALVSLIPIIGQLVVLGWGLNVTRRVMARDPQPLPDLDFGNDLARGFQAFVIGLVYALPIILISGIFGLLGSLLGIDSGNTSDAVGAIYLLFSLCFGLFSLVYGVFLALALPAAYANFLAKGSLGAGLNFGEVFRLVRAAPGAYLLVLVGSFIVGLIAPLGVILCFVGVLLTYAYGMAVMGHLYGQAYNQALQNLGVGATPA
ncbi:DUF4013 domain-containing protein [uncultured Thermanaerothrix sp.]|uniref:DUF4013 domain-containing protein n=1 Tax=uncultured Thermanaerothrix sp. TaxID=1195149 RepID=UPI00261DF3C7|nr:DUF4013 domain-containing protein [uncultured Thermanaerothrix sp.]